MEYQIMAKSKTTTEKRMSVEEQIKNLEKEVKTAYPKRKRGKTHGKD